MGGPWSGRKTDLLHETRVVPHQPFFIHHAALPMPNGDHLELEGVAGWSGQFATTHVHRAGKRAFQDARHSSPFAGSDADGMFFDRRVWRKLELRLQFLDVVSKSSRRVPIGVVNDDVFAVALAQQLPLLPAVDVEVEVVEVCQIGLLRRASPGDSGELLLHCLDLRRGRGGRRTTDEGGGADSECSEKNFHVRAFNGLK